ncbi:unnamed protein product [Sphagnum troendelagicum]|uniref:Pentatricopeptide repeat-containing protein n=1 Tax=Sphagnum troendelagicum TaxID=128251 RepID=A0ABP0U113_9BRYO
MSGSRDSCKGTRHSGLFQQMQQEGVQPDSVTFVGVLKACASMVAIEEVGVLIRTSLKAVWNLMSLWGVA